MGTRPYAVPVRRTCAPLRLPRRAAFCIGYQRTSTLAAWHEWNRNETSGNGHRTWSTGMTVSSIAAAITTSGGSSWRASRRPRWSRSCVTVHVMGLTVPVRRTLILAIAGVVAAVAAGCGEDVNTVLEKASRARQTASDLLVDVTKAADAANRAVMAETDEASVAFAREAEQGTEAVERDAGALGPILQDLKYTDEARL